MSAAYSHVGRREYTGHYAVTADAERTPGKTHALNRVPGKRQYVALCGVVVHEESGDHFLQDRKQVALATPGHRVSCKRCRKVLGT
jgi:hypothetical protein